MTPSIIFMGTPEFSVPPLLALHGRGFHIPLVISQPDRPKGRGQKMIPTPVKQTALELGLDVFQPASVNKEDVIARISELAPDFFVVVAFGQLISIKLLSIPKIAPINIHGSILPAYRGAAPIQRALLNGDSKTGVTTMIMAKGMDSGDMLLKGEMDILLDDTSETLYKRLSVLGAELIVKTLDAFIENRITPIPQDHDKATFAPMLSKTEGRIDWARPSSELDCFIRGMNPWPGAYTFLDERRYKIFKVRIENHQSDREPGSIIEYGSGSLVIKTGTGALSILEIQGDSGKRLPIADFLRGASINKDGIFK